MVAVELGEKREKGVKKRGGEGDLEREEPGKREGGAR